MLRSLSRYACIALTVVIPIVLPRTGHTQAPPDKKSPLTYVAPTAGATVFTVDRVEGQLVFTPAGTRLSSAAQGLRIALFDAKQGRVANTLSGNNGQFVFTDIRPGAYTLVVGEEGLHGLSIPLRMQPSAGHALSTLLLRLREKTDPQPSVVTPITNNALRIELLEMVRKDQAIRNEWIKRGVEHPDKAVELRMAAVDAANLARMKEITRKYGWPGSDLVGVDGTEGAFLLVQHAQHAFQKEMLPYVEKAFRGGELTGNDYALLLDRVRVRDGKPQVYGTQARPFAEWKNREPLLDPIEDEAHVDQRRAEVGMPSLADYRKMLKKMYFPEEVPKP